MCCRLWRQESTGRHWAQQVVTALPSAGSCKVPAHARSVAEQGGRKLPLPAQVLEHGEQKQGLATV